MLLQDVDVSTINMEALLEVVKRSCEDSDNTVTDIGLRPPTKRPVPSVARLTWQLAMIKAEDREAICQVFGDAQAAARYRGELGNSHELQRARMVIPTLREKRPIPTYWDMSRLTPLQSGVVRFYFGMVDDHDWTLPAVAAKLGAKYVDAREALRKAVRKLGTTLP